MTTRILTYATLAVAAYAVSVALVGSIIATEIQLLTWVFK